MKLISKTTLLTLFICCSAIIAKAQLGFNFSRWDIGANVALNTVQGDLQTQKMTPSINFNFTYNLTPYANCVFEGQFGKLAGGDSLSAPKGGYFNNDFFAFVLRGQLQLGEFMDYSSSPLKNALKNLYVSTGIGLISNSITQINRFSVVTSGDYIGGENSSQEAFIPVRIGYEFKLFNDYHQPSVKIDLGYEVNFVLGDGVDGFAVTPGHHDRYTQITLGAKFAFGGLTSYKKQIQY